MDPLWLLKGNPDTVGWRDLERDAKAGEIDVEMFDRHAWAVLRAEAKPTAYEGFEVLTPPDGLYIDPGGSPMYIAGGEIVDGPLPVIAALGDTAKELLEKLRDPLAVLERLGRAF